MALENISYIPKNIHLTISSVFSYCMGKGCFPRYISCRVNTCIFLSIYQFACMMAMMLSLTE